MQSSKKHQGNPDSTGIYYLKHSLQKAFQGKHPCRIDEMVIGSVCLPVRFAGSKQGEEQIKGQTRMNNISVQSKKHQGLKQPLSLKLITFLLQC